MVELLISMERGARCAAGTGLLVKYLCCDFVPKQAYDVDALNQ